MRAALQRGRVPEGEGRGMSEVLTWLFNDGSSSMLGGEAESMSVASLQVRCCPTAVCPGSIERSVHKESVAPVAHIPLN